MNSYELMNMKNLNKISGYSFEDIVESLEREEIAYTVLRRPEKRRGFFRESKIEIMSMKAHHKKLRELLGYPKRSRFYGKVGIEYYYALYEIGEDFDPTQLDGKLTFEKGNLVERVILIADWGL